MRVITWNVAKRVSAIAGQAAALAGRDPDVVALQELTAGTWPLWRAAFTTIGLEWCACSLDDADPARQPISRRRGGVAVAAAARAGRAIAPLALPRAETCAAVEVDGVAVYSVHVPNAANGWTKVETLEALRSELGAGSGPRVVCGDFNTPRRESPAGDVMSFARDSRGKLRADRGERWDQGELGVVPGLRDLGFRDAFRTLHGYADKSPSWTWRRIAGHGGGYRLDHVFTSAELEPERAVYHHEWRDSGLSDHAALEVDVAMRQPPA